MKRNGIFYIKLDAGLTAAGATNVALNALANITSMRKRGWRPAGSTD